jgi:hypothetical protein
MLLQIFSRFSFLFDSKTVTETTVATPAGVPLEASGKKRVFLNEAVRDIKEREIVILGSSGVKKDQAVKQELKNGNTMIMNADGSSLVRNAAGQIIKTCDVMRITREYKYDEESGALMVKRFGLWTVPDDARLDEAGTLFFTRDKVEIEERLSGLHIQTNTEKGITIQTHHHNNFELVKLANGEIWKRETSTDKETFVIWKHGKLSFRSETYFEAVSAIAQTPNGNEPLVNVSRMEQSWSHGVLSREKFTFKNKIHGTRQINIRIQLGTGSLSLRNVSSLTTTFEDGETKESTFELAEPATIKVDIPGSDRALEQIVRIRSFVAGLNIGLCFESKDGDEYVVFVGTRGLHNRDRAAAAMRDMDELFEADGIAHADLVLR